MSRPALLDRRLLFVTGKGGVGKTAVAASLALLGARLGKRTLVCEVDAKGDLAEFFGAAPYTAGYENPGPNVVTVSSAAARPGDIVILYVGSIGASGGNAGHAQLILSDGYIIQSGGGSDSDVNVSKFPSWPGWGMTLFTVKA